MNTITDLAPPLRHTHRDLTPKTYANGFTHWHYMARPNQRTGTAHTLNDICAPGYFRDIASKIVKGDWIDVSAHDGAMTLYVVEVRNDPDWVRCVELCRTGVFW